MESSISDGNLPARRMLQYARWELIPMKGVEKEIGSLPEQAVVTVTCSPAKGLTATLDLVKKIAAAGHQVVPHLSARMVESDSALLELLHELRKLAVKEAFVVGGDRSEPMGPFPDSYSLLRRLHQTKMAPKRLGITGYPEGHPTISQERLMIDIRRKQPMADYLVTQMCFDPDRIVEWVKQLRTGGITLPIYVGIPGAVGLPRLLTIATSIGVGSSLRFLKHNLKTIALMVGGYDPSSLVESLLPHDIAGFHIYTFNRVASTEAWRRSHLE